jgi:hypothetical protein
VVIGSLCTSVLFTDCVWSWRYFSKIIFCRQFVDSAGIDPPGYVIDRWEFVEVLDVLLQSIVSILFLCRDVS